MDYLDVVVHVFTPETREYYRLEQLWGEAPAQVVERYHRVTPAVGLQRGEQLRGDFLLAAHHPG